MAFEVYIPNRGRRQTAPRSQTVPMGPIIPLGQISFIKFVVRRSNIIELENHINTKLNNFLVGSNIMSAAQSIGNELKFNVINANRRYNLLQSGQFLREISRQQPRIRMTKEGNKYSYVAYFGDLTMLSRIYRPTQRVLMSVRPRANSLWNRTYTISRTITIMGEAYNRRGESPFPYWIAVEFGTLSQRDPIPERFSGFVKQKGKSSSEPYRLYGPLGMAPPAGHKKKIFLMLEEGTKPHPGVQPSRIFRTGLAMTFPYVDARLRNLLLNTWGATDLSW